jgi:hypothetical protein
MIKQANDQQKARRGLVSLLAGSLVVALTILASFWTHSAAASPAKNKIFAQALVETTKAKHPELEGVGLSTTPADGHDCISIADTDAKELGDKCDQGELKVMKTGKSTVEKENDGYDVTMPFHVGGKTIGVIAMDFKLDQQEAGLLDRAKVIAAEIENQIPSKSKLFEPAQ